MEFVVCICICLFVSFLIIRILFHKTEEYRWTVRKLHAFGAKVPKMSLYNILCKILRLIIYPVVYLFSHGLYAKYKVKDHIVVSDDIPKEIDTCVILGAMLFEDDSIPPILKERLDKAGEIYSMHPDMVFILSGDGRKLISNDVIAMRNYLIREAGIPDSNILLDKAGYNTFDSVRNLILVFHLRKVLILTSAFHTERALYTALALKLNAYAVKMPDSSSEVWKSYRFREMMAVVKTWFIIHWGEPRYGKGIHKAWFSLSLFVGKSLYRGLRLLNYHATTYPGRIMLKMCPYLFQYLTEHISMIIVTGTNGKTSTCRLAEQVLQKMNISCFSNNSGANLRFGVATALLAHCDMSGNYNDEFAVIECDEGDFAKISYQFKSSNITVVVTNLFRDQLDRYGEIDRTKEYILSAVLCMPQAVLCLNADCSLTSSIGKDISNRTIYYGIDYNAYKNNAEAAKYDYASDGLICPDCGIPYRYHSRTFAGLGDYYCPQCHMHRPDLEVALVINDEGASLVYDLDTTKVQNVVRRDRVYEYYNELSVSAVLYALGKKKDMEVPFVTDYFNPGRSEKIQYNGKVFYLSLVKNAVGFQQAICELSPETLHNACIIFALSDATCDGRDVSWIWDCDISVISQDLSDETKIFLTGLRSYNMAVRLNYAGVDKRYMIVEKHFDTVLCDISKNNAIEKSDVGVKSIR